MAAMLSACFIVTILSGCATNQFMLKGVNQNGEKKDMDFRMEPYQTSGLLLTPALKNREATIVLGTFSKRLLNGEWMVGRLTWKAFGVDTSGNEYAGQYLFSGATSRGIRLGTLVMDVKNRDDVKAIVTSTELEYGYDILSGNEFRLDLKFRSDPEYRRQVILKNGTRLGDMNRVTDFYEIISKWNRYQTPEGILLSPLGESDLKFIASINPQYSYLEKFVGSARVSVSADYISTSVGLGVDVAHTFNVASTGIGYGSVFPTRREMAMIMELNVRLDQEIIDSLNSKIDKRRLR
jgi:hypothetical protein